MEAAGFIDRLLNAPRGPDAPAPASVRWTILSGKPFRVRCRGGWSSLLLPCRRALNRGPRLPFDQPGSGRVAGHDRNIHATGCNWRLLRSQP